MDLQYTSQRAHPKKSGHIGCGGALGRRCCRWACRTASPSWALLWVHGPRGQTVPKEGNCLAHGKNYKSSKRGQDPLFNRLKLKNPRLLLVARKNGFLWPLELYQDL